MTSTEPPTDSGRASLTVNGPYECGDGGGRPALRVEDGTITIEYRLDASQLKNEACKKPRASLGWEPDGTLLAEVHPTDENYPRDECPSCDDISNDPHLPFTWEADVPDEDEGWNGEVKMVMHSYNYDAKLATYRPESTTEGQ